MALKRISQWVLFLSIAILLGQLNSPIALSESDIVPRTTIQELKAKMDKGADILIVDVRTGQDYESSTYKIKGAIRIPFPQLESRLKDLPRDKEIVFYCS